MYVFTLIFERPLRLVRTHRTVRLSKGSPMSRPSVFYLCPECLKTFSLSGSRLKEWVKRKRKKPTVTGPYCDYRCSSAANVRLAVEAKKTRLRVSNPR